MKKRYLSAQEFLHDCWRLASIVRKSPWRPDAIVALWRGGAGVGVAMHEYFKYTGWDVRHYPLKCSSYSAIGENSGEVEFFLKDELLRQFSKGENVLVVDDVFDTGKTAKSMKDVLSSSGVNSKIACVYWKREKNTVDIQPDYYAADMSGDWIVFPHEIEGLSIDEIGEKDPFLLKCLI